MLEKLLQDYDNATAHNYSYLMSYYRRHQYPKEGTANYYKFLQLLKFLEHRGFFNREALAEYTQEG